MKIVANRLVGEVVNDIVIGVRSLGLDFQSGQVKHRVATPAAYFGIVALKISTLFFGDVIGWISCASMLRVMKFFVYSIATTLPHLKFTFSTHLKFQYLRNFIRQKIDFQQ